VVDGNLLHSEFKSYSHSPRRNTAMIREHHSAQAVKTPTFLKLFREDLRLQHYHCPMSLEERGK
jgi:hypothetical protein